VAATIDSVTTGDSAPTDPPHRISEQPGKRTATVKFTPSEEVTALEVRRGGEVLEHIGNLVVPFKVGAGATVEDFSTGLQQTVEIDVDELPGEGTYDIDVYEHPADGAWG
jgi:hypothetical protein